MSWQACGGPPPRSHARPPDLTDDEKKVGDAPTPAVPAKLSEFRSTLGVGLRRQGFLTPDERSARAPSRKGCQKLSHNPGSQGKQAEMWATRADILGPRGDLPRLAPADIDAAGLAYLRERADDLHDTLGGVPIRKLSLDWSPELRPHIPNRAPRCPVDRRGSDWTPKAPAPDRPLRRAMYRLRDALRPLSQPRVQACGRAVVSPDGCVGVLAGPDGRVRLSGLAHCGSVWECPVCQMTILQARAEQVRAAVERWGADRVAMLTLTIRHGAGEDLRRLRRDLSRVLAAFSRHRGWRSWCRENGLVGRVRALEVTHGPNGWHPHFHFLLVFEEAVDTEHVMGEGGALRARWACPDARGIVRLWRQQVRRFMGEAHEPDDDHAAAFTLVRDGEYLSKMGLELTDPGTKLGRALHRTPLQIASDYVDDRRPLDGALWRAYCVGMRGAHRLVWSNGLRARLGVADLSDEETLAEDEDPTDRDTWIASIPRAAWDSFRDRRVGGDTAGHWLIVQAERGGAVAFDAALLRLAAGEV
jgi:hypothetical protein